MKILTLDLAQTTGWAHSCGLSGIQNFKPRRGDSPGMCFIELRAWLNRFLDTENTELIVYEQAGVHRSNAAHHSAHGFIATLEMVAIERKVDITSRSPTAIKKFALPGVKGKGARNKTRMMQYVENRWPHLNLKTNDEADAIILLWMVLDEFRIANTAWHRSCVL